MDLQDHAGLVRHGRAVVADPRAVRRPHLRQPRPGGGEDVGDPELTADLDQLTARDDDRLPLRQGGHREQERCGAVVDHHGPLGARERGEQGLGVLAAPAPASGATVDLDVGVGAGGARRCPRGALGERGAPEVRVQDHAGRVDHGHHPVRGA